MAINQEDERSGDGPEKGGGSPSDARRKEFRGITQVRLRDAKANGVSGFNALYEHIAPAVYAWAELRLRRDQRAEIDPQDLVQEVWFRAWRSLQDFDDESVPFRRWIFRVAKIVMLELLRDGRRGGTVHLDSDRKLQLIEAIQDPATAVSQRLARDEMIAKFLERVDALPDEDRRLFTHCGLEDLTYAETARRLDSTEAAVARRWQRLRLRLIELGLPDQLTLAGDA